MPRLRRLAADEEASLVEHLEELRHRLFVVLGALGVATVVAFAFHGRVLDLLNHALPPGHRRPITLGVAEPFTVSLRVSLYAGFVLALPIILWQVWSFFVPAFDERLKRRIAGLFLFATALGVSGLLFGYAILLPRAIAWLTSYGGSNFDVMVQASPYYTFVCTVLLGFVAVFELPVFVLGLVYLGVLSADHLRRNRRLGYFLVAVVALGLPGPDPVTTALELLPMWALFEGSIWLAVLAERRAAAVLPEPEIGSA